MASIHKPTKLKFFPYEKWEPIRGFRGNDGQQYAISNFGRAISYWKTFNFGYFLKPTYMRGIYPCVSLRKAGKGKTFFIHLYVGKHFLPKPPANKKFLVHIDHQQDNNHYKNLKWVTYEEKLQHVKENPDYYVFQKNYEGHKLNAKKVKMIKQKLAAGKTTMRALAEEYGISEMHLYRIKAGINWGHVTI